MESGLGFARLPLVVSTGWTFSAPMSTSSNTTPRSTPSEASAEPPSLYRLFIEIWNDYPLATRAATVLLVTTALLNIAVAANGGPPSQWGPLRWVPAPVQAALSSDGITTLLSLSVALGIGLHLKQRQLRGLLDGTDHYDIGRALAYGYFSNFLVAALLLVRMESRKKGRTLVFRMIFPRNIRDLENFKTSVEPAIRELAGKRELEGVYKSGASVIKRSMLIVSRASAAGASQDDLLFDFPTTLYTLHDYYQSWNLWLRENGRAELADVTIEVMQERQVGAFKRHLTELFRSEVGLKAVRHLGIMELEDLTQLFRDHFLDVEPAEMLQLLTQYGRGSGGETGATASRGRSGG